MEKTTGRALQQRKGMAKEKELRAAELTEEIVDQIIFGMENQDTSFLFDLEKGDLIRSEEIPVEASGDGSDASKMENRDSRDRFVRLPEWSPVDGFHLMERFVAHIKNPIYRQEMRDALNGGRGVFRRFKDVLKRYEPLERQWFIFKEKEMRQVVRNWYAGINDAIFLNRLGEEPEETEDLVLSDFILKSGIEGIEKSVAESSVKALKESVNELPRGIRRYLIETKVPGAGGHPNIEVIYAETPPGDFAGCIAGVYHEYDYSLVLDIRFVYVEPPFRGLGLSRLLIDRIGEAAVSRNASEVVVELLGNTLFLQSELEERGFREFGRRYALNIEDLAGDSGAVESSGGETASDPADPANPAEEG